jgi:CPA2 family monovalent cation:H+ antiporter-2
MVQRGEFSTIIASLALPQLRIFSGIYILVTAFVGVVLFNRAPDIAKWYHHKRFGSEPMRRNGYSPPKP